MDNEELKHILKSGADELGISLGDKEVSLFLKYLAELKEWNKKINLTSIKKDRDIIVRHFLDSLILTPFVSDQKSLLDIGSGAGFPGIPLKIALPHLKITLMDSINKKVNFMRHIIRILDLKDIEAVHARAEEKEISHTLEASFDVVTSRAFAELGLFLKIAIPYAKKGGVLLAMKGPKGVEELKMVKEIQSVKAVQIKEVKLPFSDITTTILALRKG